MLHKVINKYKTFPVQIKASFWFLFCGFLTRGISVITTPIFTRLLTTAEYGQFSVFNSWYGIVSVFLTLNLYCGVYTQGMVKYENRRKEFSSSLQGLCLTIVTIWTFMYFLFRDFWNQLMGLSTIQIMAMILLVWLAATFQFWSVEQRVDFKYRLLVLITLFVTIIQPALSIFLVLHVEDKVTARILGMVIVEIVSYTWCFFSQMFKGKKFYSSKFWKNALAFNLPLLPHYLSMTVLSSADRIMIDKMVDSDVAGIYNLAYSISLIMTIFNTALMQTIEPWLYKKIKAKEIEGISKVALPSFVLIAGVNVILILFAPEIISIFAPPSYSDAIWIVPPVAMSVYFMFAYSFFAVFEFYYEKTKYIMVATTFGALLNIVLNYVFISIFGYYAAGYTTLICYIVFAVFHFVFMKRICNEHLDGAKAYDTKVLLIISLGFVATGFIILFTYQNNVIRYLLISILIIAIFLKRHNILRMVKSLSSVKK